ncbi:hypothetical protein GGR50DRAFT_198523 [Xylaria sp. CBS 124048]|nr:hypothetical protein GGR50DRAFT_198523 [Xylaria sp. CBS 124048]
MVTGRRPFGDGSQWMRPRAEKSLLQEGIATADRADTAGSIASSQRLQATNCGLWRYISRTLYNLVQTGGSSFFACERHGIPRLGLLLLLLLLLTLCSVHLPLSLSLSLSVCVCVSSDSMEVPRLVSPSRGFFYLSVSLSFSLLRTPDIPTRKYRASLFFLAFYNIVHTGDHPQRTNQASFSHTTNPSPQVSSLPLSSLLLLSPILTTFVTHLGHP